MRRLAGTNWFRCTSNIARRSRCFGPPRSTRRPSSPTTCSGPRIPNRGLVSNRSSAPPGDRCVGAVTSSPTYGSYTGPRAGTRAFGPPCTSPQRASDPLRPSLPALPEICASSYGCRGERRRGGVSAAGTRANTCQEHLQQDASVRRVCGRVGTPRGPPLQGLPALHDVDPLARHLVASELEQLNPVLPGTAVVADRAFDDDHVVACGDPSDPEAQVSRVPAPPLPEVGNAFESLSRLWKLQHRVVVVDLDGRA